MITIEMRRQPAAALNPDIMTTSIAKHLSIRGSFSSIIARNSSHLHQADITCSCPWRKPCSCVASPQQTASDKYDSRARAIALLVCCGRLHKRVLQERGQTGPHVMDCDHQRPPRAERTKSCAYRSGRLRCRIAAFMSSRLTRPSRSWSKDSKNSRPGQRKSTAQHSGKCAQCWLQNMLMCTLRSAAAVLYLRHTTVAWPALQLPSL